MTPQLYLELPTNLNVAACEEWLGREYARDYHATAVANSYANAAFAEAYFANGGAEYPYPPDSWIGPPSEPPPEAYTFFYLRAMPMANTGGVIVLDDQIVRFATQHQTLSNGEDYFLDVTANAKTVDQLSAAAVVAITPPQI